MGESERNYETLGNRKWPGQDLSIRGETIRILGKPDVHDKTDENPNVDSFTRGSSQIRSKALKISSETRYVSP